MWAGPSKEGDACGHVAGRGMGDTAPGDLTAAMWERIVSLDWGPEARPGLRSVCPFPPPRSTWMVSCDTAGRSSLLLPFPFSPSGEPPWTQRTRAPSHLCTHTDADTHTDVPAPHIHGCTLSRPLIPATLMEIGKTPEDGGDTGEEAEPSPSQGCSCRVFLLGCRAGLVSSQGAHYSLC